MIRQVVWFWLVILGCVVSSYVVAKDIPLVTKQIQFNADLRQPTAVAVADNGHVYVLDGTKNRVVVFSEKGDVLFSFGNEGNNGLDWPMDISISGDRLVIADTGFERLVVYDLKGQFIKEIEVEAEKSTEDEKILQPVPISVFLDNNIVYWGDRANHRICKTNLNTDSLINCFGGRGETEGLFQFPWQIGKDRDGYFHIVDVINARVQVLNKNGRYFSQTSRFGISAGELFRPNGIVVDGLDNVFVTDSYMGTVSIFNAGKFVNLLKTKDAKTIHLKVPVGLALHNNLLYVVDAEMHSVYQFTLSYVDKKIAGVDHSDAKRVEISEKNCVSCHLSWAHEGEVDKQLYKEEVLPVASFEMCYSCHHGVVMDSRLMIKHKGQHPTIYDPVKEKLSFKEMQDREDEMPKEFPVTKKMEMLCTTCHTPHNSVEKQQTLYSEHRNSWLRVSSRDGDLCERCHESKTKNARELDKIKRGINHPLAIKLEKPPKTNEVGYATDKRLHEGLPDDLKKALASLSSTNQLICQSCHQVHGGEGNDLLAIKKDQGAICAQCHPKQFSKSKEDARRKGIHPINVKLEEPIDRKGEKISKVTCDSCHKVHDGSLGTDLLPNQAKTSEDICIDCHERQHAKDKDDAFEKGIHPMNHKLDESVKIAGKKFKLMSCLNCHSIHDGEPKTPALVEKYQNGELCLHCHENKSPIVGTDHDLRITAKDKKNQFDELPYESGVCGTCHTMHRGEGKLPRLFAAKIVKPSVVKNEDEVDKPLFDEDRLCLNCHQKGGLAEERLVSHFSHPTKNMVLRSDEKIMPLLDENEDINEFGAIACMTCHEAHLWEPLQVNAKPEPSSNRKNREGTSKDSYLRRLGVTDTFCIDCHSLAALPKYKYYHDKDKFRNIGVDYFE